MRCHRALGDSRLSEPTRSFAEDVHQQRGFGCAACHGGDPNADGREAMAPARGFVGVPARNQIPALCGRCHADPVFMKRYNPSLRTDQVAQYRTSKHGQLVLEVGDSRAAVCTDCHTSHAIRPASDPQSSVHPTNVPDTCGHCHSNQALMGAYSLPTDQVQKYRSSVHWNAIADKGDLSAPACNDCHGDHGATPPGVDTVTNVCRQCHGATASLFESGPHRRAFLAKSLLSCTLCHDNHAITLATDNLLDTVCSTCHTPSEPGAVEAAQIRQRLAGFKLAYQDADRLLDRAARAGVEVSQARFELSKAQDALIQARAATHTVQQKAVGDRLSPGAEIVRTATTRGHLAMREARSRRIGLGASLVMIAILIGALLLKIRRLKRDTEEEA